MSSTFVDWDLNGSKKQGGGKNGFLKLQSGNKYKVRLVSKPIQYFQHWDPIICRSPGSDPATGQTIDPLMQMGYEPKKRYAIWVIDRKDENQFKIMDFPETLYKEFAKWKDAYNEDPGGLRGPDWQITIEGKGLQTRYTSIALDRVEFTDNEKTFIKSNDLRKKIEELRRANTPEEIKQLLAQKGGVIAPKSAATPPAAAQAQAPVARQPAPPQAPASGASMDDFKF